jgi:transcriptional regulator with XRE-family HTH domain
MGSDITARRFRMAMASANVSMRDVGKACGVSAVAVGQWTRGVCLPRASQLVAFSKITGASLDWLMCPDDPFGPPFIGMRNAMQEEIDALKIQLTVEHQARMSSDKQVKELGGSVDE